MNQRECFERLGFTEREGDSNIEMSIGSLVSAIVQSIDHRLADSAEGMEDFKPYLLAEQFVLLKREDELLFIAMVIWHERSYLEVSGDAGNLFGYLSDEGLLDKIINKEIVAELQRLNAQAAVDREAKAKERRRAEFEKLKLEFEGELDIRHD